MKIWSITCQLLFSFVDAHKGTAPGNSKHNREEWSAFLEKKIADHWRLCKYKDFL